MTAEPGKYPGILFFILVILCFCRVQAGEGQTLSQVVNQLESQGLRIIYSSDVEKQVGQLNLEEISLATLKQALEKAGLIMRETEGIWVIAFPSVQTSQTISGRLVSVDGQPISGGKISLTDSDQLASSDAAGWFRLANVANDAVLVIQASGYRRLNIITSPAMPTEFILIPNAWIENIIVTGSHYRFPFLSETSSHINLQADEIQRVPTLGSDALRLASRLPGASSVGVSSKPHIRGGLQDEVLILMDGVELLEPFHLADFHQGYSSIDSRTIDSFDIYTGGFPARYGNRMSGVMSIDIERELPEFPREIGYSKFSRFANIHGESSEKYPMNWIASMREGDLDQLTKFLEPLVGKPRYLDAMLRVNLQISEGTELTLGSTLARDDNEFFDEEEDASSATESYYFWGKLNTSIDDDLQVSLILNRVALDRKKDELSFEEDGKAGFIGFSQEVEKTSLFNQYRLVREKNLYEFGLELSYSSADYQYMADFDRGDFAPLLGNQQFLSENIQRRPSGWSGGLYFGADLNLSEKWSMQPSLRWDWQNYYFEGAENQLSPRFGLSYHLLENTRWWISVGRFYQPQGINELQLLDGERDFFKPQRSDQIITGIDWLSGPLNFKAELYYKRYRDQKKRFENLFNPFVLIPEIEPDRVALEPEKAFARGIDLELRCELGEYTDGVVRYSYMDAQDKINGQWAPRRWSQENTVNAIISWQKNDLTFSAALSWHSGWRSTFLPESIPLDTSLAIEQVLNNTELRNYLSLDISASKSWVVGSTRITLYGDISNLLKRENISGVDFEFEEEAGEIAFTPESERLMPRIATMGIILAF